MMYHPMMPGSNLGNMAESLLPKEAQEVVPFLVEPYRAYRIWTINFKKRKYPALQSITYRALWPPRQAFRSHCLIQWGKTYRDQPEGGSLNHSAPNMEHRCGIYGVKEKDDLNAWSRGRSCVVIGEVLIWGKVFEYQHGYISEYAYPIEIVGYEGDWKEYDPIEVIHELSEVYGIDIGTIKKK